MDTDEGETSCVWERRQVEKDTGFTVYGLRFTVWGLEGAEYALKVKAGILFFVRNRVVLTSLTAVIEPPHPPLPRLVISPNLKEPSQGIKAAAGTQLQLARCRIEKSSTSSSWTISKNVG